MKKNIYIQPAIERLDMQAIRTLCASDTVNNDPLNGAIAD